MNNQAIDPKEENQDDLVNGQDQELGETTTTDAKDAGVPTEDELDPEADQPEMKGVS